jgi:hypothetical protein
MLPAVMYGHIARCRGCGHPSINHPAGFGCLFPGCSCGAADRPPRAATTSRDWQLLAEPVDLALPDAPSELWGEGAVTLTVRLRWD